MIILQNITFLKKKRTYHGTIHDGTIGMTSWLVGLSKQATKQVSD